VEVLYGVLKTLHIHDVTLRSLITLSRIAQSIFLIADHIIWVGRTGLVKINTEKWKNLSNRCWLYSITLNLIRYYPGNHRELFYHLNFSLLFSSCRDLYEIKQAYRQYPPASIAVSLNSNSGLVRNALSSLPHITSCCMERRDIAVDTVKNICDIFIPLSNQGHLNINSGIIGFLGVVSSIAGICALIDPSAKICPT